MDKYTLLSSSREGVYQHTRDSYASFSLLVLSYFSSHKSRVSGSLKVKLLYYNSTRLRGASRAGNGGGARSTSNGADRQLSIGEPVCVMVVTCVSCDQSVVW